MVNSRVMQMFMERHAEIEKKMAERPPEKCCFCGCEIQGFGHNPAPVRNSGTCCDACNDYVISVRLEAMEKYYRKVGK